MNSLKEFLEQARTETKARVVELTANINKAVKKHDFKNLLFFITEFMEAEVDPKIAPPNATFFSKSNLFFMGEDIDMDPATYGADPEFILCDSNDDIVLYSSKFRCPSSSGGEYSMSSLAIGADYGLLELRPFYSVKAKEVAKNVKMLIKEFDSLNKELDVDLKIKEAEAVPFMHKIQRLREIMDGSADEIDFGSTRYKLAGVTSISVDDISIAGAEYYGVSLTAYDTPGFTVGTEKVLTAGGHLHFGGAAIKVLSMKQLKALVRKLDKELMPMSEAVETSAGKLRRKYYGMPGEFRLKPYGFEYRVLSCAPFWAKNNEVLKDILEKAAKIITTFDFK